MPSLMFGIDASGVVSGAGSAVKAINSLTASASGAQRMMTNIAVAVGSFKTGSALSGINMLAARYETLGIVMTVAGKNVEYTYKQMDELDKALQREGISMLATRSVLAKMSAAYIDLGKASELAKTAQNVAVVGGINSSEALERMTGAIVKAEIEMLRTIGINANFEQGYKANAAAMGKTIDQLTEYEKIQSRVNTVISQGAGYAGIYTASMLSAGKQITSIPRLLENITIMTGEISLDAFATQINTVYEFLVSSEQTMQQMRENNDFAKITENIAKGTEFISDNFKDIAISFGAIFGGRYITKSLIDAKASFGNLSKEVSESFITANKKRVYAELADEHHRAKESLSIARKELDTKKGMLDELQVKKTAASLDLTEARMLPTADQPGGTKQNEILIKRQAKAYRDSSLLVVRAKGDVQKATDNLAVSEAMARKVTSQTREQLEKQSVTLSRFAMNVETSKLALSKFGTSIVNAFGGPVMFGITAAMTALSVGMLLYKTDAEKAEKSTNKIAKAMADLDKLAPIDIDGKISMLDSEFTFRAVNSRLSIITEESEKIRDMLKLTISKDLFQTGRLGSFSLLQGIDITKEAKELQEAYDSSLISTSKYVDEAIKLNTKRLSSFSYTENVSEQINNKFIKNNTDLILSLENLDKQKADSSRRADEIAARQKMVTSFGSIQQQALAFDDAKMQKALADIRLADFKSTLDFKQQEIVDAFTKVGLDFGTLNKLVSDGLLNINTTETDLKNALVKYNEDSIARRDAFIGLEMGKVTGSNEYMEANASQKAEMTDKATQSITKQAEGMFSVYTYSDLTLENLSKIASTSLTNLDTQEKWKTYELEKARITGIYRDYQEKLSHVTSLELANTKERLGLDKEQLAVLEMTLRIRQQNKDKTMDVGGVTFDYSTYATQLAGLGIVTKDVELNVLQLVEAFSSTYNEVERSKLQLKIYTSQGLETAQMVRDTTDANNMLSTSQNAVVQALLSSGASLGQVRSLLQAYASTSLDAANAVNQLVGSLEAAQQLQQSDKLSSFMNAGTSKDKSSYYAKEIISLGIINDKELESLTMLQKQQLIKESIAEGTLGDLIDPSQLTDGYTLNDILQKINVNYKKLNEKNAEKSSFANLEKEVLSLSAANDALEANSSTSDDRWERRKLAIERTYEINIAAMKAEIEVDKRRATSSERALLNDKERESLRKETLERDQKLADIEGNIKAQELSNISDRASFYEDLASITNSYNYNIADSNALLAEQAQKLGNLGIPEEYIEQWKQLVLIQKSTDPADQLQLKLEQYGNSMKNWGEQTGDSLTNMFDGLASGIGNFATSTGLFFTDSRQAVKDLGTAFSDVAASIISDLAKIYAKMLVTGLVQKGMELFTGFFGFGGSSSGGSSFGLGNATKGLGQFLFPSANGNVLGGGNISDYSNSIVSKPTYFGFDSMVSKFAKGGQLGVAGEAGKEAIMPLGTTSSGKLGVHIAGGRTSAPVVNITFIDNVGVKKKTEQKTNDQGGVDLQVMIDQAVSTSLSSRGSQSFKTMSSTWQGSPALANR